MYKRLGRLGGAYLVSSTIVTVLVLEVRAASFSVPPDSGATAKTVTNNDTGNVASGNTLAPSGANAILWQGGGTTPGVVVTNNGTIGGGSTTRGIDSSSTATGSFTLTNAGTLTSTDDAFRLNPNTATAAAFSGTVTVNNSSTIVSTGGGQAIDFGALNSAAATIVITNAGTGVVRAVGNDAIRPGSGTITITNSGLIDATTGAFRAINLNPANLNSVTRLTVTNNAGATIQSQDDTIRIAGSAGTTTTAIAVTVDNSGTISASGVGSAGGQAIDFDNINSAAASVTITNRAGGVITSADADAIRPGQNFTINNFGQIVANAVAVPADRPSADGIDLQLNHTGTVNNYAGGLISGAKSGTASDIGSAITVFNDANATIIGRNGAGISSGGTATVTNYGTVTGAIDATSARGDGDGIDIDFTLTLTNYGTIQGTGAKGYDAGGRLNNSEGLAIGGGTVQNYGTITGAGAGIVVNNDSNANNTRSGSAALNLVNNAGATIVGQNSYAIRSENKTGTAADNDTIVNYGAIVGNGTIPDPNAVVTLQNGSPDPGSVGTLDGVTYTGTGAARFIRGDGSAIQTGEGSDTLTNYGTITGNTGRAINMEGGDDTLNLATGSTITGRIDGGAGTDTINLFGSGTGTLANVINFEVLNVQGGVWSLLGAQGYVNGVTIANGATLRIGDGGTSGSLAANVANNGVLAFNRSDALTFAGVISGSGAVQQIGSGTTTLTGASTYTGPTTISAGRLLVNGSIASSAVTVLSGGTIGGIGTIGALATQSGGTVAPGNAIGQLNVAGSASFAAGSTYQVEVNATGQNDRIVAAGRATLSGGTVQVMAAAGNYAPTTRYTILTASGGVVGGFANVTSDLAFLFPSLSYDANDAFLTLTRNDVNFASVASTRNGFATGVAVSSLGPANPVYLALLSRSVPEAARALDLLSGDVHSSAVTTQFESAQIVQGAVLDRLRGFNPTTGLGLAGATVPAAFAADLPGGRRPELAPVPFTVLDPRVFALWGQGFGSFGSTRTDGNAGTLTRDTGGFIIGADATLDGQYRFGLAGGFTDTNLDVRSRASSGEVTSGFGALYGAARFGGMNLRVGGIFAGNSTNTTRNVAFPGFSDSLTARFGGTTLQGFGEAGYQIAVGPSVVEPFAGVAALRIARDGFTERGGAAALTVFGRDYEVETVTAGLRGAMAFGSGSPFSLKALIGYRHAFGDVVPATLLAFAAGGAQFQTAGVPIDRNAVVAEAGLDWQVAPDVTLGLSYSGQIGQRAEDHGAKGNILFRF